MGDQPFLLINGDIWTDFKVSSVVNYQLSDDQAAWLLLVENPEHNPEGDFGLANDLVSYQPQAKYTFSGISLIRPQLIMDYVHKQAKQQCFPLRDVLRPAIEAQAVSGTVYRGQWCDVGTVERYKRLNKLLEN